MRLKFLELLCYIFIFIDLEKNKGFQAWQCLAESHISVHTWPERDYIAFDIFMCGDTKPEASAEYLIKTLKPKKEILKKIKRGVIKLDR